MLNGSLRKTKNVCLIYIFIFYTHIKYEKYLISKYFFIEKRDTEHLF